MSEARRTNPGFLSNNEAARDRKRTHDFVRSIVAGQPSEYINKLSGIGNKNETEQKRENISVNPEFWSTKKGLIIRAIVLNRAYNKEAIIRVTQLKDEEYREAATELFLDKLILPYEKISGNLCVTRELYLQCKRFFQQTQEK